MTHTPEPTDPTPLYYVDDRFGRIEILSVWKMVDQPVSPSWGCVRVTTRPGLPQNVDVFRVFDSIDKARERAYKLCDSKARGWRELANSFKRKDKSDG